LLGDWSITDDIVANYVVRNDGDAPLEIERVTFLAQGYRVVSTMPLQINPWEESTMQIAYNPAAEGDFSTTMNIYTNDPTTRMKAVAVSGHVYEPNTLSVDGERMQDGSYQLAISLDNYTNIVGVQYDIHWRSDMTTSQAAFTPTVRLQNHTYAIMPIGQNTYRVLIYSLSNTPITGKEGELHQLLFTPQGDVDYCGDVLTIDNIVLSNANGTDKVSQSTVLHHLPTTQYSEQTITACDQYVYNNKVYQSSATYIDTLQTIGGCDSIVTTYLTILPEATTESEELALCPSELPYEWHGQSITEAGTYSAAEPYAGMECDSVIHELTLNVYVQTLPASITLPTAREGEVIDVVIPTAEIQALIGTEVWYAPNALVVWYIQQDSDWTSLTDEPVATGIEEVVLKYVVETDCGDVESDSMVIAVVPQTGIENIHSLSSTSKCQKILYEDHIYIIREGKVYSVLGQEM
jgi:hypothetical protein